MHCNGLFLITYIIICSSLYLYFKGINVLRLMTHLSRYIYTDYKNAYDHTHKNVVIHIETSNVYSSIYSN